MWNKCPCPWIRTRSIVWQQYRSYNSIEEWAFFQGTSRTIFGEFLTWILILVRNMFYILGFQSYRISISTIMIIYSPWSWQSQCRNVGLRVFHNMKWKIKPLKIPLLILKSSVKLRSPLMFCASRNAFLSPNPNTINSGRWFTDLCLSLSLLTRFYERRRFSDGYERLSHQVGTWTLPGQTYSPPFPSHGSHGHVPHNIAAYSLFPIHWHAWANRNCDRWHTKCFFFLFASLLETRHSNI